MSTLAIPQTELADFARLPEECRQEVHRKLAVMRRLTAISRGIQAAIAEQASLLGMSPKTLRNHYDLFRKTGDWRVLVNRSRFPQIDAEAGVPASVVELWQTLCERYKRKCKPAFRELERMWQRGEPRDLAWPERDPMTGLPRGCTYRNLMRHAPSRYELTLARIGKVTASAMLPKVLSTRIGAAVGQIYVVDDQDYDVQVAFVGVNRKMTRPSGFNALDFASAAEIVQGYKPTILNADGSKQKLRQVDFEWFIVNLLTVEGYREDTGTLIIGEHGTAKGGKDFMERVHLATGGKVTFDASGIHGQQLAGMFRGQPRGNPRYKAGRESWFNLLRNEMAALPGQTGMDRQHAPEENYGLDLYVRDLLDVVTARPELAEDIALPVLRWPAFLQFTAAIVRQINLRTEHNLEGWADRVASEWRLDFDQPWQPAARYLALPAPQRAVAEAMIQSTPGLWRTRKLAPWEVWESGRAALTKIDGAAVPVLLGEIGARVARVRDDHQIVIEDGEIEPEPMWFDVALSTGRILGQREEVLAYLNPFHPQALQICDRAGRWLGTAARVQRIGKLDVEALQRRYGAVKKIEAQLARPVAQRGAELTRQRTRDAERNGHLLGAPTPAEKARVRSRNAAARREPGSLSDLVGAGSTPGTPAPQVSDEGSLRDLI